MTVNELIEICKANDISLDTHIAVRAKDDYFPIDLYLDVPYFGNCRNGTKWQDENCSVEEDGTINDDEHKMIILDIGE